MTNVSIPEVNVLENSSILAVFFRINLSITFGLVSENGPRKIYFMDSLTYYYTLLIRQYFVLKRKLLKMIN